MVKRILMLTAVTISLSACSLFSPVASPNTTYLVNTLPDNVPVSHRGTETIMIATTDTVPVYNTVDMAYTTSPYQVAYFAKSSWAETPAQMLKPLLVQTLYKTHHFRVVTSSEISGVSHYVLRTQILEFRQVFNQGSSAVHIKVSAQLVKTNTGMVTASNMFDVVIPATQNTPFGGVVAANAATAELLKQIAEFCVRHT